MQNLDVLCGSAPTELRECPVCGRVKGPYYSSATARDALAEHITAAHPELLPAPVPAGSRTVHQ